MPAPQATMMKSLAKLQFKSFGLKHPTDWRQPQGQAGEHLVKALKPPERSGVPDPSALFIPSTSIKFHTDGAKTVSDKFTSYIDGICTAICGAWDTWQKSATMAGIIIAGPVATGGQVIGMPWTPIIMAQGPVTTPMEMKYTMAIASAIDTAWQAYQATIKVAGMPWYPAFAAFPGPMAPPMPNIPCPIAALVQVPVSVSKMALKGLMIANLADPMAMHHMELFDCIADAFDKCFKIWQVSTMVTNVLGTGPIPTFAPPFVPVGPVLGGVGTMPPGGFQ